MYIEGEKDDILQDFYPAVNVPYQYYKKNNSLFLISENILDMNINQHNCFTQSCILKLSLGLDCMVALTPPTCPYKEGISQ